MRLWRRYGGRLVIEHEDALAELVGEAWRLHRDWWDPERNPSFASAVSWKLSVAWASPGTRPSSPRPRLVLRASRAPVNATIGLISADLSGRVREAAGQRKGRLDADSGFDAAVSVNTVVRFGRTKTI